MTFKERVSNILSKQEGLVPIDLEQAKKDSERLGDIAEEYSPSFSYNNSSQIRCALYSAQGQGSDPICWAASVATIVNYRTGSSLTARQVCDDLGVGYVGQNIDFKKTALQYYGLSYTKRTSQLTWSQIYTNISNMYPIAASTFSNGSAHAVTVYGRVQVSGSPMIVINSKTWTWEKSLSQY